MILSDSEIIKYDGMITPFQSRNVSAVNGKRIISYGLSSYGYDFRLGSTFKLFGDRYGGTIDPKEFSVIHDEETVEIEHKFVVPPRTFVLSHSLEHFVIPRNIIGICMGKSTYARCGIIINVTALEPEWEGQLTIEISNTSPLPVYIYPGEGIGQLIFMRHDRGCITSYKDKMGKYMNQEGITYPKV